MKKISLCFNDRKKNKKQKLENFFFGGGVHLFGFIVQCSHNTRKKKKTQLLKKYFQHK